MKEYSPDFIQYVETEIGKGFPKLLFSRGIKTKEEAERFLYPKLEYLTDPFLFSGMREIVKRIDQAVNNSERVVIYGDYDCDGICATYVLYDYLSSLGVDVHYFIPDRIEDGYGLSDQAIERIAETYFPDLVITVDCGISSANEVEYVKDLGMDVIVTDHHELPEVLPDCLILNTKLDAEREFSMHAGAGTAFLLVSAHGGIRRALDYVDVVAVATIGDIVPLLSDNRIIVSYGLRKINSPSCNAGIKQFFEHVGVGKVTSSDVSFRLVPGINAFGRLGDANRALELFTSDDRFILSGVIDGMIKTNNERKELCKGLEEHVLEKLKNADFSEVFGIVEADVRWAPGVLGIAAAYVSERFHRPVILFSEKDGVLKGSGRSTEDVDLLDAIKACSKYTIGFGGHRQAAGVSLKKEDFEAFRACFNAYVKDKYAKTSFVKHVSYDIEYEKGLCDYEYVKKLDKLEPCGQGNPRPRFLVRALGGKCTPLKSNPSYFKYSFGEEFAVPMFQQAGRECVFASSSILKEMVLDFKLSHFSGNVYVDAGLVSCSFLPLSEDKKLKLRSVCTGISKNSVINTAKCGNIEEIVKKLSGFGTLFIGYDNKSINKLLDICKKYGKDISVFSGDLSSVNPVDALLVLPLKEVDVSTYKTVVFLDIPVLNATGEADFVHSNIECSDFSNLFTFDLSREGMGEQFRIISQRIGKGMTREELFAIDSDGALTFAYYVFTELGIVVDGDVRPSLSGKRSELSLSKLYAFAQNGCNW